MLTPKRAREGSASARGGGGRGIAQQQDVGWDSESDEGGDGEDGGMGFSPPKTMQFHIPQGRLMRTPGMLCFTLPIPLSPSLSLSLSLSLCVLNFFDESS